MRPSTKAALRAYATGAVKTIGEAAAMYGMAPSSLYFAKRTATGIQLVEGVENSVAERAVSVSALIAKLSEKAVNRVAHLMEHGGSESIQLAAAKDLLDRNPETSKTQKIQAEGFTLGDNDAKALAAAMVEAARVRAVVGERAHQDVLRIAGEVVGEFTQTEVK